MKNIDIVLVLNNTCTVSSITWVKPCIPASYLQISTMKLAGADYKLHFRERVVMQVQYPGHMDQIETLWIFEAAVPQDKTVWSCYPCRTQLKSHYEVV